MINKDITCNEDGTFTIIDNRIFSMVVENQIKTFKQIAMEEILKYCPEYKQRNAALGLLDPSEESYIRQTIQKIRNKCSMLEQQVLSIEWDGAEESRGEACDRVQQIYWYFE
jgi:hypothetical protein